MQVWISNHGGRQLDSTHGTFTVLPRIAQAIRCLSQDVTIIVDGGVCRGGDIVKAVRMRPAPCSALPCLLVLQQARLRKKHAVYPPATPHCVLWSQVALGADAVAVGRLTALALSAGGEPALTRALDLLLSEATIALGLMGATSWAEIGAGGDTAGFFPGDD
eukprot:COSAG01_NODE_1378_length_10526_cov_13.789105_9_plen_162_part_00